MSEWGKMRLGDICSIKHGFAFKGEHITAVCNRNILLTPGNFLIGGGYKCAKLKYYNGDIPTNYILSANDIVITMTDLSKACDTLGYSAKIPCDNNVYLHNQRIGLVEFNNKYEVHSEFIYWLLRSFNYQKFISNSATGSTVKHTSPKIIQSYEFDLPPLEEQKRIAGILGSLDDKIEINNKINANLEEQAQALFKRWFVDFEFPDENGNPYKSSGGEFIDSELGQIPNGWTVGELGNIIELFDFKRIPLSGNIRDKMEKKYPYYGAASLMDYVEDYIFDGIYLLLGEDGTVVDTKGFPILQYVWGKFWVNNHAHIMLGINGYSVELLHVLLKITNVQQAVTGAVQPKINQANLRAIKIVIPMTKFINELNNFIQPTYNIIRKNKIENQNLIQLRDTLLPKLMNNEIKL